MSQYTGITWHMRQDHGAYITWTFHGMDEAGKRRRLAITYTAKDRSWMLSDDPVEMDNGDFRVRISTHPQQTDPELFAELISRLTEEDRLLCVTRSFTER